MSPSCRESSSAHRDASSPGERVWRRLIEDGADACFELARTTLNDHPGDARAAFCLAHAAHALDRAEIARTILRDHAARPDGSRLTAAIGHAVLATLARDTTAPSSSEQALDDARHASDRPAELVARELLAVAAARSDRTEAAADHLVRVIALAGAIDAPLATARAHYELGQLWFDAGKLDEAIDELQRAADLAESLALWRWHGDAERLLSHAYAYQSNDEEALTHRQRGLTSYRKAGDTVGQVQCMHSIAMSHAQMGRLTEAATGLAEAMDLAERIGDADRRTRCEGDLGVIAYFIGDLEEAHQLWSEAIDKAPAGMSSDWRGGILSNMGVICTDLRRYDEALGHLQRALAEIRSSANKAESRITEVIALNNLGRLLCVIGRVPEALDHLRRSIECSRRGGFAVHEAYALRYEGLARAELGETETAIERMQAALALADRGTFFGIQESTLADLARLERQRGDRERALQLARQAVDVAEGVRRRSRGAVSIQSSFFGSRGDLYAVAVDLLCEMHEGEPARGFHEQAFELAQRAKARSFCDLLTESQVDVRSRAAPEVRRREQEILEEIARLLGRDDLDAPACDRRIAELDHELELLEARIRSEDPRYAEILYPRPAALEDVRATVLLEDDLLLEFLLGDDGSFLWAVTHDTMRLIRLPARAEIQRAANAVLPLLRDYNLVGSDATYLAAASKELSDLLLGAVAGEVRAARRCIIVPHDVLHYVPFEALLLPSEPVGARSTMTDLPFLVRHVDVAYAPSIGALARLQRERGSTADRELLLVGDPTIPANGGSTVLARVALGERASEVPHGTHELTALRDLFDADSVRELSGTGATLSGLRSAIDEHTHRLVHFSTHGVFNEHRPRLSGLALSPDAGTDDGFLSIGEVFALDLPCDQVVLSSCSSALGEHVHGEGLVGLSRAFLFAGARSVVATLWEVAGRQTAAFMQSYYEALGHGDDRARALAETKRRMIGSGPASDDPSVDLAHPYFWSAFVLSGASD